MSQETPPSDQTPAPTPDERAEAGPGQSHAPADAVAAGAPAASTASQISPGQMRDRREAAFAHFMTSQTEAQGGEWVTKAGGIFLLAAAGFVVVAAIAASA